jgi:hypothetical protein
MNRTVEPLTALAGTPVVADQRFVRRWLVAEYCGSNIFSGWWLYLRENPGYQKRNANGDWGWLQRRPFDLRHAFDLLKSLGCEVTGDGTMSNPPSGVAKFAKKYPLPGRRVWGKRRGGIEVVVGHYGELTPFSPNKDSL